MKLKISRVRPGLHPSESVVAVKTVDGVQRLVVSEQSISENTIEVGAIRRDGDRYLVELPRETQSGEWRVWVFESELQREKVAA